MIKIGIVDDHAIVRAGLRQFFSDHVDLRVVGEAGSGREAIDLIRAEEIDVLIMDLAMPGQSGLELLQGSDPAVRERLQQAHSMFSLIEEELPTLLERVETRHAR